MGGEAITYNGSNYFHGWGDSTISNQTWLNRSSGNAQMATTEGQGIEEAVTRMGYYKFNYGIFRNNSGVMQNITTQSLDNFDTYGYTDNATYWRAEANRSAVVSGTTITLRLKHEQRSYEDLLLMAFEYNASRTFSAQYDYWLGVGLTDIQNMDLINYGTDDGIYSVPVGGNASFTNWSIVKIANSTTSWGWRFENESRQETKMIVDASGVWLYFLIVRAGGTVQKNGRTQMRAIDDVTCLTSCNIGDSVILNYDVTGHSASQVAQNLSYNFNWTDSAGTCILNNGCGIKCTANNPYTPIGAQYAISEIGYSLGASAVGSPWLTCNQDNATNKCNYGSSPEVMRKDNPVKNTNYIYAATEQGRYAKAGFLHTTICVLNGLTGYTTATAILGTDTVSPNVTRCYPYNGTDGAFTNNTAVNFYPSNGSMAWVNATFACAFDNESLPYSGTGLVNHSFLSINKTGFTINYSDLTDKPWGYQIIIYTDLQQGKQYRVCGGVNGTARVPGTGADTNWTQNKWCWWFQVNIVPSPTPYPQQQLQDTAKWRDLEDDDRRRNTDVNITNIIVIILLAGFTFFYINRRQT